MPVCLSGKTPSATRPYGERYVTFFRFFFCNLQPHISRFNSDMTPLLQSQRLQTRRIRRSLDRGCLPHRVKAHERREVARPGIGPLARDCPSGTEVGTVWHSTSFLRTRSQTCHSAQTAAFSASVLPSPSPRGAFRIEGDCAGATSFRDRVERYVTDAGRSNGDAGARGDECRSGHEPCREMAALVKGFRSSPRRPSSIRQIKVGSKEVWR